MSILKEFNFQNTYELADLIDNLVKADVDFWNYNEELFVESATKFSKDTLLHLYIVTAAINHYRREFRKNGDLEDEETMEKWYSLFENYKIEVKKFDFDGNGELTDWFDENLNHYEELFDKMADEVFYILFSNRKFLLDFNNLTAKTISGTKFSAKCFTKKGTIKRTNIPKWVQTAIFHRDKGRCVFCFTDLTSLINTLTNSNYDHIVPLDLFGTNDPCNIQLTCESCNKKKTNKEGITTNQYIPWWTR